MALDDKYPVEVDIQTSIFNVEELQHSNKRFVLGYLTASYLLQSDWDVHALVYFKRAADAAWESISIKLSPDNKSLFARLPNGLMVVQFYVRISGWAVEFELTELDILTKTIAVGKFGGRSNQLAAGEPKTSIEDIENIAKGSGGILLEEEDGNLLTEAGGVIKL
jgi:hypothetical protein